ncbi:MAG: ATP-grasp domain-containing protein [Candidatus Omnitrophica bacterium]|nr:ATP-grasp domain-containing protein [Candidatus Omnitrophota bacterium]
MHKPRILMTSVGGLVAPNMMRSLRHSTDNNIFIVGVDAKHDAVGFHFADKSYVVLPGESEGYGRQLLNIAEKENIDVVLPLSDEELLALASYKRRFEKKGICVACSEFEVVKTALDKGLMLQFLKDKGLPCPDFRIPNSLKELERSVLELGYPKKRVVFKPRRGRGARGFWLLDDDLDKKKMILESRERQQITLGWLLEALDGKGRFPDILVMEYLSGSDFNVDVLAWRGDSFYIVPNERLVPDAGPVQVGCIRRDKKVGEVVRRVVKEFNFDYYVNVEVAYRNISEPFVYEINPRISAPIVANKAAGIDLLNYGIRLALGERVSTGLRIKETRMFRFWDEVFIHSQKNSNKKAKGFN